MGKTAQRVKHQYREGDTAPALSCEYKDSSGSAIDVTGWTIVLTLETPSGNITVNATLTDPTNGLFEFAWTAGQLVSGFNQKASVTLTNLTPKTFSGPRFLIDVRDAP